MVLCKLQGTIDISGLKATGVTYQARHAHGDKSGMTGKEVTSGFLIVFAACSAGEISFLGLKMGSKSTDNKVMGRRGRKLLLFC